VSKPSLPFAEFVALIAILFSLIAFGTDAMLPAFPDIARDLNLSDANRAQLVLSSFVLGTGVGQLFSGPLSDTLGRKPVIAGGIALFIVACLWAYIADSLSTMLLARFIQGLGISAPRTVTLAMVRDLFAGRMMARVMSIAMAIFVLVPAVAPAVGQVIATAFGWRAIYVAFILFSLIGLTWLWLRQGETHPPEQRRALNLRSYFAALTEVLSTRSTMTYTAVLSLGLGALFAYLSSAQQVFAQVFQRGESFPAYFAAIALISGSAGFVNAALVVRLGMQRIARFSFGTLAILSATVAIIFYVAPVPPQDMFPLFLLWSVAGFFSAGLTFGNLNALAMEPMGHIAGMASAIVGATATVFAMVFAVPIGLAFNGTVLPLVLGSCATAALAFLLISRATPHAP